MGAAACGLNDASGFGEYTAMETPRRMEKRIRKKKKIIKKIKKLAGNQPIDLAEE